MLMALALVQECHTHLTGFAVHMKSVRWQNYMAKINHTSKLYYSKVRRRHNLLSDKVVLRGFLILIMVRPPLPGDTA